MKCITCNTYEINERITDSDSVIGKSFCSRLCKELYMRSDLQFISDKSLKRIALNQHDLLKLKGLNNVF